MPWFRVYTQQLSPLSDSVSLRLPYSVKLATECKSLTHYTKGTQSPQLNWPSMGQLSCVARRLFASLRFGSHPSISIGRTSHIIFLCWVSGSISLPFRGSFRLSLTVLVHYRSITSI